MWITHLLALWSLLELPGWHCDRPDGFVFVGQNSVEFSRLGNAGKPIYSNLSLEIIFWEYTFNILKVPTH